MSRGHGVVQRRALDYLRSEPFGRTRDDEPVGVATWWICEVVYGHADETNVDDVTRSRSKLTTAQLTATRRALAGLERDGLVLREERPADRTYWRHHPDDDLPQVVRASRAACRHEVERQLAAARAELVADFPDGEPSGADGDAGKWWHPLSGRVERELPADW